jgi:hypothetical protein
MITNGDILSEDILADLICNLRHLHNSSAVRAKMECVINVSFVKGGVVQARAFDVQP